MLGRVLFAIIACAGAPASAQNLEPITDRNYVIDLYRSNVIGSGELISIGGAGVSSMTGTAGMLVNPAAIGVRPETSTDRFDWDFHVDWLNPTLGDDPDLNGLSSETHSSMVTAGLGFMWKTWAVGLTLTSTSFATDITANSSVSAVDAQLTVAKAFWRSQLVAGLGFQYGGLDLVANDSRLFNQSGATFTGGIVYMPEEQSYRIGVATRLAMTGNKVNENNCDPYNCAGYILPDAFALPAQLTFGGSYRLAKTHWNRKIEGDYRDERHVTASFDVRLAAPVERGAGIEAFILDQYQRSGQTWTPSFHFGLSSEIVPGIFRLRAGTYWESPRFEAISGRIHGTAGLDVRLFQFHLWGAPYRIRLSGTCDFARNYGNYGVSVGFWH